MLVLNKLLQRTAYIRFSNVGYSQAGAIARLLTKKSNVENLIKNHLNILIQAIKLIVKSALR